MTILYKMLGHKLGGIVADSVRCRAGHYLQEDPAEPHQEILGQHDRSEPGVQKLFTFDDHQIFASIMGEKPLRLSDKRSRIL